MMTTALFAGFGALLLISSLMVILHKNPVTSALFLVLSFCSLAGLYLVMEAEFLGMVQIIIYAGAIMVLFLFVIMYLNLGRDVEGGVQIAFRRVLGWLIGGVLIALGGMLIGRGWMLGPESTAPVDPAVGNTQALGALLYTRYLFPFEVTSILLLVAMVGAVVIARGRLTGAGRGPARARAAAVPPGASPSPAPPPPPGPSGSAPSAADPPEPVGAVPGGGGAS